VSSLIKSCVCADCAVALFSRFDYKFNKHLLKGVLTCTQICRCSGVFRCTFSLQVYWRHVSDVSSNFGFSPLQKTACEDYDPSAGEIVC